MVAQSDTPDDAPDAGGHPTPGRAVGGRGGDPTASDPPVGALIRTKDRPAPAGTALEEDRMRNRAW
jgi:hypothetical protein